MKFRYQVVKRQRIKRLGFISITNFAGYWWSDARQRWEKPGKAPCSTCYRGCRSVKAFKRLLQKWSEYLPPGIEFILVSRWVGYDISGRIPPKVNSGNH